MSESNAMDDKMTCAPKKVYPSHTPEARRAYRLANMEHYRARGLKFYYRNREKILAERAKEYAANPAPAKERANKWRKENPERHKKSHEEYRAIHAAKLAEKQLARYHDDIENHRAKNAARRKRDRAKIRADQRKNSAQITDRYVREQLGKYSPLHAWEFPQSLVDAKRAQILLKRTLKHKTK